MRIATVVLFIFVTVPSAFAGHGCSPDWSVRLYPWGSYGVMHVCYGGIWRTACEYDWTAEEVKVACNQLGYTGGCQSPVTSAGWYWGYSWSYTLSFYFDCTGTESALSQCSTYSPPSYYYCNDGYYDSAGAICSSTTIVGSDGCSQYSVQLLGGSEPGEGRPEVCIDNTWTPMCSLSAATASVICQELGFTEYTASTIYADERYGRSDTSSYFSSVLCSDTDTELSDCVTDYKYLCSSSTCSTEYGMKCFNPGICTDGEVRLVGGDIEQEGRAEVCYNGVWGVICDYGWSTIDGFIFCTDLGYVEPGTGPDYYYNSYFGAGDYPMVYSYVNCNGWEKNFVDCPKDEYPNFTYEQYCTRSDVIGLRCYEDCTNGDIRLTGGTDSMGTVEICYGSPYQPLWGLVAETGWTVTDAQVACRQLGFPTDSAVALVGSPFGKANKTIHLTNVNCVGSEERIDDCTKNTVPLYDGKTIYASVAVAGVQCAPHTGPVCFDNPTGTPLGSECNSGDVTFADNADDDQGTLLFCYKGQWSPFCSISEAAAAVACKQRGYAFFTGASVFTDGDFPLYMNHSLFTNITCSSDAEESSLAGCDHYETECLPYCENNIVLRCYNPGTCPEGEVRLVNSIIEQEGRVEVCFNGVWSSICDDGWDKTDAYIVCSQLGYGQLEPVAYYNSYFGDGDGPIVYSQVACGGWEDNLNECNKTEQFGFSCSRQHVAGVLCGFDCVEGDLRLTNNETSAGTVSGIVEVCFNNLWGLISESGWSEQDAQVACRQLGYEAEGAARVTEGTVTKPNKTVHLGNVICLGDELSLSDCSATSYSLEQGKDLLDQVDIARVSCPIPTDCEIPPTDGTDCQHGQSRLTPGSGNGEGNLEYCYNGYWSPVCNLAFMDAAVACREFGYDDYSWASVYTDGRYGSSGGDVVSLFTSFNCTGSQFSLEDCSIIDNCTTTCSTPVAIKCYEQQQCEEGAIHLVDGDIDQEGRVEVCINGVWGSVCSNGWDKTDAFVTCKYLGYGHAEPVVYKNSEYGEGQGPIVISNVVCEGWERSLTDCDHYNYGSFYCSHDKTIGIFCHNDCNDGEIRLVGNEDSDKEGIVEICFGTLWGIISDSSWSNENAKVVCSQLNFTPSRSRAGQGTSYTKPNTTVHLSNVMCTGEEDEITNCEYTKLSLDDGKLLTSHVDAASVECDIYVPDESKPSDGDGSDPAAAGSEDSSVTTSGLAIIGGLGGVFVVMVIVLVIAVTVLGFKAKHVSIMRPNDGQEDTFPLDEQCIKTDLSTEAENPIFDAPPEQ